MKLTRFTLISFILAMGIIAGCHKDDAHITTEEDTGNVVFKFAHYVDSSALQKDTMIYTNAAGNQYEVNQVKYFISDVQFHKSDGKVINIDKCKWAYYVDNDIPSTMTWDICDKLPVGTYDSISFQLGIISSKNISYIFINPPEVYMQWPVPLGGGYHYIMINGKWKDSLMQIENFNTHLGIGRIISGGFTFFVDNSFHVKLPASGFTLSKNATREIQIIMNIDSWYKTPFVYDHNYFGQMIMENEIAMHMLSANGFDVFSVGYIH